MPGQQASVHARGGVHGRAGRPAAGDQDRAGPAEAAKLLDRLAHDALVVKGVAGPDDEESEPKLDEDEDEDAGVDPDATDVVDVDAGGVVVWLPRASAGSWPDTSCTKTPPVVARKIAVAAPMARRRIIRTRRRRACRVVEGMATASVPFVATA